MQKISDYIEHNRNIWEEFTLLNIKSDLYNVDKFKKGANSLDEIVQSTVGEVKGKSLLHLQCNIGLETLSFARLGANVTGIDYSKNAIDYANSLKSELKIKNVEFFNHDIYFNPFKSENKYDIVFSSYGSICWFPDLKNWLKTVSNSLSNNGFVYIVDFHPILIQRGFFLCENMDYTYFNLPFNPLQIVRNGNYANSSKNQTETITYNWNHSIGDILNSLIEEGLQIVKFQEYPYMPDNGLPKMIKNNEGFFISENSPNKFPLIFTLKASINV